MFDFFRKFANTNLDFIILKEAFATYGSEKGGISTLADAVVKIQVLKLLLRFTYFSHLKMSLLGNQLLPEN